MFEKRANEDEEENAKDNDEDGDEIPLVVWLTGGPGCSSTLALLTENGPCKVNDDGKSTTVNPYSWTEAAHVLWLDQVSVLYITGIIYFYHFLFFVVGNDQSLNERIERHIL
jgi:hypothetical protein